MSVNKDHIDTVVLSDELWKAINRPHEHNLKVLDRGRFRRIDAADSSEDETDESGER